MKITLKKDHSIRGKIEPAESVVEVSDGVADDLIVRGVAEKVSKPKPKVKPKAKEDK